MYRLNDLDFMREALRLAAEGTALASPNPRVGAVVVREGEIVGRGVHLYERQTHAEVMAMAEAGERAQGGTLYLNLEPCCHTGRTPPCSEAVIAAGIKRVVAGMIDPNPGVAGEGLKQLAAAGIAVESGCLGREAQRLNEDFAKWIRTGVPFVTLKAATSLDGRIAATASQPTAISSNPARERVQQMRHQCDAVLAGVGTVLADNPLLTDRTKLPRRRPLLRVILDAALRTAATEAPLQLFKTARRNHDVLIFHAPTASAERRATLEKAGARLQEVAAAEHGLDLGAVLRHLGREDITSVLLEAGGRLNGAMLAGGWVDKLVLFQAPLLLGASAVPLAEMPGMEGTRTVRGPLQCESVGPDVMIEAYLGE